MRDGCTILVVDDDLDIRETLAEIFADDGCTAVTASNGVEALDTLRALDTRPCVILLDLMMPVMDGYCFRARQSSDPELREIPVVVITAFRDVADIDAARKLEKPMRLDQLRDVVRDFCRNQDASRPVA